MADEITSGPSPVSHKTIPSFRFLVVWKDQVEAVFAECSGLTAEVETEEYKEGGQNEFVHKLPGRRKWSDITLKRGLSNSLSLWQWYQKTVAGQMDRREVTIMLFDETQVRHMQWNVKRAFPIKWEGPSLKVDGTTVGIETLVLTHEGFEVKFLGG